MKIGFELALIGFVFCVNRGFWDKNAENWLRFAKKGGFVKDSLHLWSVMYLFNNELARIDTKSFTAESAETAEAVRFIISVVRVIIELPKFTF